jgi:ABC-2 type transport system permease protein
LNVWLIARRDLGATLHGYTGWVLIAAILFLAGVFFQVFALGQGAQYSHEVLQAYFEVAGYIFNTAAVLVTMRSFAEERQLGTEQLLASSPVASHEIVLGKYLAASLFLVGTSLLTLYLPALIFVNGKVSVGHIAVGYVGLAAMSTSIASVGIFMSSLFRSQVAAAITTGITVGVFVIAWMLSDLTAPPFTEVLAYAALWDKHYTAFIEGTLRMRDLVFYASLTGVSLFGATRVLDGRRWQ